METPGTITIGISNLLEIFKVICYRDKRTLRRLLIPFLITSLYTCIFTLRLSFFENHLSLQIILIFLCLFICYLFVEMILVEYKLWDKGRISPSRFTLYTDTLSKSINKKYNVDKILIAEDILDTNETIIEKEQLQEKFEKINLDIEKLNTKVLKKMELKINCERIDFKEVFNEYRLELFENLHIDSFVNFLFYKIDNRKNKDLLDEELKNIISVLSLLRDEKKIIIDNSKLTRLLNKHFSKDLVIRTVNDNFSKGNYRLMNHNIERYIKLRIAKFKRI